MIVNPFNIFLFRQVFLGLPDDVYEAAQLDHCGPVKYFFTMVLPMSKSVVATVSVFTFLNVWNDYLWPSLVFTSSDLLTAQIGLNAITSNDNHNNRTDPCSYHNGNNSGHYYLFTLLKTDRRGCNINRFQGGLKDELYRI